MSKYSIPVCSRLRFLLTFSRYSEIRVLVFGILLHIQKWHSLFSRQITRIYSQLVCWFHQVFCVATYRLCLSFSVSFSLPFFEACEEEIIGTYLHLTISMLRYPTQSFLWLMCSVFRIQLLYVGCDSQISPVHCCNGKIELNSVFCTIKNIC